MKLTYKAATKNGKILFGIVEAKDATEAVSFLRKKNLVPITIKAEATQQLENFLPFLNRYKLSTLILFTRQLASMLTSGLTLIQALTILNNQMQNGGMREIIIKIIADIEEGKTFAQSIEKYPRVFSPIYIALIKAGESSGFLDTILQRLATNLEKQQQLRSTIKSALIYPVIVIFLTIIVIILMMIFFVPLLTEFFKNSGISLPITTQIVIATSNFFKNFWLFIIAFVLLAVFLYTKWKKTVLGKHIVDKVLLHIPIMGKLVSQSIIVEFSRTFGLLMSSGALVTTSLRETANITGNIFYTNAILDIALSVEKGITIGRAMESYTLFPPMLIEMIKIGEQTGKLDESLLKVSDYFDREVATTIKNLTTIIEPVIMVVLGVSVAFIILSILVPMYQLTSAIK